jgi:hypothetical protein
MSRISAVAIAFLYIAGAGAALAQDSPPSAREVKESRGPALGSPLLYPRTTALKDQALRQAEADLVLQRLDVLLDTIAELDAEPVTEAQKALKDAYSDETLLTAINAYLAEVDALAKELDRLVQLLRVELDPINFKSDEVQAELLKAQKALKVSRLNVPVKPMKRLVQSEEKRLDKDTKRLRSNLDAVNGALNAVAVTCGRVRMQPFGLAAMPSDVVRFLPNVKVGVRTLPGRGGAEPPPE